MFECRSLEADGFPLIQKFGAEFAIELDRGRVPVEHLPAQAKAIFLPRNRSYAGEQCFSNVVSPILLANINIFEENSGAALEG